MDRRVLPAALQAFGLLSRVLAGALLTGHLADAEGRLAESSCADAASREGGRQHSSASASQAPVVATRARSDGENASLERDRAVREAARKALERGLAWLASAARTTPDGSLPRGGARETAPVAVTALGALAWMAGGSAPDRGPHGLDLGRAIDWLTAHTELDPQSERAGYIALAGDALSRMHGHGLAALALSQAAGLSPKSERGARIERALAAAIACIERCQGVEGGWWYEPKKSIEHEGSITICEVQALRAAHNAGFHVNPLTIARALDYLARSQKPDGSFRYALGDERSTLALTAAAIGTLNAAGKYEGAALEEAYDNVFRGLAARERWIETHPESALSDRRVPEERDERHAWCAYYERLYLAQALWQRSDREAYASWAAAETRLLLGSQREDGSWEEERFGDVYATAMNCLVLAIPEGLLPIFQR